MLMARQSGASAPRYTPGPAALLAAEQEGDPLAAADAQRDEAELVIGALHLVEDLRRDQRAGRPDRVTEGDRASVGVRALLVEAERADDRKGLSRKGLVEFDDPDLVEGAPALLQDLLHRGHRANAHDRRIDPTARVG